uniref:Cytochrome c oxidase assembly factor 1 n=3 Tax=Colobinae TaxID=9569 RepID=A0A2K6K1U4_RHIBE
MMWQKYPGSRQSIPLGIKVLFGGVFGAGGFALVYYLIQSKYPASHVQPDLLLACSCSSIRGNT